jgi:hypothetical protein
MATTWPRAEQGDREEQGQQAPLLWRAAVRFLHSESSRNPFSAGVAAL